MVQCGQGGCGWLIRVAAGTAVHGAVLRWYAGTVWSPLLLLLLLAPPLWPPPPPACRFADRIDGGCMLLGLLGAAANGSAMPMFSILFGDL